MRTDSKTLPEKLVFKDFIKAFRAQYMYGMPDLKNYMITEQVIHKNNRDLHGIIIRSPGKRIAPVFYYEDFYKEYLNGESIDDCIRRMGEFVAGITLPDECFGEVFSCWEKVKDKLVVKLINLKKNHDQLISVPHMVLGDMAVVVQIYLDDPSLGKGSVMVDKSLLDIWQIERSELFDVAFENMDEYGIRSLNLLDFDPDKSDREKDAPDIFVISYDAPFPGASAMLRTDYLVAFARKKESDYYILPVSVHEVLLIQKKTGIGDDMLINMLHAINHDKNISDNMLSEEVFYLDHEEGKIQYLLGGKELQLSVS